MEPKKEFWHSQIVRVVFLGVASLAMLIPLEMVRSQINDRAGHRTESVNDITGSWGSSQVFTAPRISYRYLKTLATGTGHEQVDGTIYPENLSYNVNSATRMLHRSIYDVPVYTAEVAVEGDFILDAEVTGAIGAEILFGLSDLKGIQGSPEFTFGGSTLKVKSEGSNIKAGITIPAGAAEGTSIPFRLVMRINGSESLFFRPAGNLTTVKMRSDYPNPSFTGEFLPVERAVSDEGFTALWEVSQITLSSPDTGGFGVRLIEPVTQYRQVERALKYGIMVIFLIFFAGFAVEMISKRPINYIQYLVIGASLVLFYALLLAFSDFIPFGLSYLIAAAMTTASLGAYFIAIVKGNSAWILTALVALAYLVIYILLQMETYAFLAGTLLLFGILCLVMYLTRNLQNGASETESVQNTN